MKFSHFLGFASLCVQALAADASIETSPHKPSVLIFEASGKDRQYTETLKSLGWTNVIHRSIVKDSEEFLAKANLVLFSDGFSEVEPEALERLKAFVEGGGVLFVPDSLSAIVGSNFGGAHFTIGPSVISPPTPQMIWITRFNKRSALLNWPQAVPHIREALYNPAGWQANHLMKFGFENIDPSWIRLTWNMLDQPTLVSRRFGQGLVVLTPIPIWDTVIWDVRVLAPLLDNAVQQARAESLGTSEGLNGWKAIEQGKVVSDANAILNMGKPFFPRMINHVVSNTQWKESPWFKEGMKSGTFALKPWKNQILEVKDGGFNSFSFTGPFVDDVAAVVQFGFSIGLLSKPDTWGKLPLPEVPQGSVLMWDTVDEPDLHFLPVAEFVAYTRATRLADPSTPVFANVGVARFDDYSECADIIGTDAYPIPIGPPTEIGVRVARARKLSGGLPVVPYVQIYDIWKKRLPSPSEVRFMIWDSIVEGARGVVLYGYFPEEPGTAPSPYISETPIWNTVKALNRELSDHESALLGHYIPEERASEYIGILNSPRQVGRAIYASTDGQNALLILTNRTGKPSSCELHFLKGGPSISTEKTQTALKNDVTTVTLEPWEARIIRLIMPKKP